MNPCMILYQVINYVDSCHSSVCGPLTLDNKDILWMDNHILTMTYEFLVTRSPKYHRLDMP